MKKNNSKKANIKAISSVAVNQQNTSEQLTKISNIIENNETVLLRRRPNRKSYLSAAIVAAVFGLLSISIINALIFYYTFQYGLLESELIGLIIVCGLDIVAIALCLKYSIFAIFGVQNVQYIFTDKRIILVSGINQLKFEFVNYADIEHVKLKVGLIDKIYKVGDIYVHTKNHLHFLFDIDDEDEIYNFVLQKSVEDDNLSK